MTSILPVLRKLRIFFARWCLDPTIETLHRLSIVTALEAEVLTCFLLGICVGMHLLANGSDEGQFEGLGWIPGHVTRIDTRALKHLPHLPHMGWNQIAGDPNDPLLVDIDQEHGFYFLHSYYFAARDRDDIVATVSYGEDLPCIVRHGHIIGAQFHPEKAISMVWGLLKTSSEMSMLRFEFLLLLLWQWSGETQ